MDLDCDGTRTGRRNDLSRCDGNGFAAAGRDDLSQQLRHQKNEELDRKIWKNRSKYFNLGYVKQSLVFKDFGDEKLKNDFGVSISWGKTYFTCTKNRCSEC